jgi:hypothetical protein
MSDIVLAAFLRARLAHIGAQLTNFYSELRISAHQHRRRPAKHRAIPVQLDAPRHRLHVVLAQTFAHTIRALVRAKITRLDTIDILRLGHKYFLPSKTRLIAASAIRMNHVLAQRKSPTIHSFTDARSRYGDDRR